MYAEKGNNKISNKSKKEIKSNYLTTNQAAKHFNVSHSTIRSWDKKGYIKAIRTNGALTGHRRYDVSSFSGKLPIPDKTDSGKEINKDQSEKKFFKKGAVYCRVSSSHQKNDLQRQIDQMSAKYPNYTIFKDIGSGINFKRPGFLKLIQQSIEGHFEEIVVAHKDRFTRFGFDFIEWLLTKHNVSLVVSDKENSFKTPEQELSDDLLSIVHVFSCRQNGRRKYKPAKCGSVEETDSEQQEVKKSIKKTSSEIKPK